MKPHIAVLAAVWGFASPLLGLAQAQQTPRDPTRAPPEAGLAVPGAGGGVSGSANGGAPGFSVIVQDGQPRLVVGTRLVAYGEAVGESRLVCITETDVWLRDGKALRKVPRFAGIERTASAPVPARATGAAACPPAPAVSSRKKRGAAAKPPPAAVQP